VVRQREVATWLLLILTLALACAAAGVARAQDEHLGITEYELACIACHGVDGRGDGPLAKTLKARPSDLTQISKASGGRFPSKKVGEMIDGRAAVAAHGSREMPVWGNRYRAAESGDSPKMVEQRARAQIDALVRYLQTLQEK
jgi:mono/diheme cytochrome c family protein